MSLLSMKLEITKPLSWLLILVLTVAPFLSVQAKVVGSKMLPVHPGTHSQVKCQHHQIQWVKKEHSTQHVGLSAPSPKDVQCKSDTGSCSKHSGCCQASAILSRLVPEFGVNTPRFRNSVSQQIVLITLPAEIKPPR